MRKPIPYGKYLLLERISVGGMAEVFKAKAFGIEGFEKIIAIKRILPTMAEDKDFIEMFIDEAKIAGQLSHANVCHIFELGRIEDTHFIAMEYVWGRDLLQIQNRFRRMRQLCPVPMAVHIAAKVCEGLDYAHRKSDPTGRALNIIHRDVSPQNVLVSYEGEVKVIDFGIAKAATRSSRTQAGVLKGKFGYMSPEQVRGMTLDRRSDIFAIGTLLYEMLVGDRLFAGESDFSTLERVRHAEFTPLSQVNPNVPPELEAVVHRALACEREDRYQWAHEMQEDLAVLLGQEEHAFTTKHLADWMKSTFSSDIAREQAMLEVYRRITPEAAREAEEQAAIAALAGESEGGEAQGEATTVSLPPTFEMPTARSSAPGPAAPPPAPRVEPPPLKLGEIAAPVSTVGHELSAQPTVILDGELATAPKPPPAATRPTPRRARDDGLPRGEPRMPRRDAPGTSPLAEDSPISYEEAVPSGDFPPPAMDEGWSPDDSAAALVGSVGASASYGAAPRPAAASHRWLWLALPAGLVAAMTVGAMLLRGSAPPQGTLVITSRPVRRADVFLNGVQAKGQILPNAPLVVRHLDPGPYDVLVRAQGFPDARQTVRLGPGEVRPMLVHLAEAASGTVRLVDLTDDSRVFIDDVEISREAAHDRITLPADVAHRIRVQRPGFRDGTYDVTPKTAGETVQPIRYEVAAAAPVAARAATPPVPPAPASAPPPAAAKVDPPAPAPREAHARADRHEHGRPSPPERKVAEAPVEKKRDTAPSLAPAAGGWGTLLAESDPSGARIWVDGDDTGRTTPVDRLELRPGRHVIAYVYRGQKFTYAAVIAPGRQTKLVRRLALAVDPR